MDDDITYWTADCFSPETEVAVSDLTLEVRLPSGLEPIEACFFGYSREEAADLGTLMSQGTFSVSARDPRDSRMSLALERASLISLDMPTGMPELGRTVRAALHVPSALQTIDGSSDMDPRTEVLVTPSDSLDPTGPSWDMTDDGSTGPVEILRDLVAQLTVSMSGVDYSAEFLPVFFWSYRGSEATRRSQIVCRIDGLAVATEDERNKLYSQIDDYLLLVGLCTGEQLLSVGSWTTSPDFHRAHFRRDRQMPANSQSGFRSDFRIVPPDLRREFWHRSYMNLCASEYKLEIRSALQTLHASREAHLESAYLMIFSSLELLVGRHLRKTGRTEILDASAWRELREKIKGLVKKEVLESALQRQEIYTGLSGLNRPSLASVFKDFQREHEISLDGLWPFATVDDLPTLPRIRNALVHGDPVSRSQRFLYILGFALRHLEWTLEVCVISLLGWHREQSLLSEENLLRQFKPGLTEASRVNEMRAELRRILASE